MGAACSSGASVVRTDIGGQRQIVSTNLSSRASSLTTSFSEKKKIAHGYLPPAPPLWLQCFFLGVVFSMSLASA